ncbi:MAG: replicative DNA helicase [Clostridia bacterium]|nr:replicative DNA helicase [Clostridia bacterium]
MAKKIAGDMPHSLEAEQALLGCLLLDTKVQVEIAAFIKEQDFFAESHQYIFSAMNELIKANQPVDLVTLTDLLEKKGMLEQAGGINYIAELTNVMPSSANYQRYFDIVMRDSMMRKLIKGSANIIEQCKTSSDKNATLSYAEKCIFDIADQNDNGSMEKIGNILPTVMNTFDELAQNKGEFRGLKTKFYWLDYYLNGLRKGTLTILAARPGVGKTSLAMNIVENLALQGHTCAVFSLEMKNDELVQRMVCSVAGVSMEAANKGNLQKADWAKLYKAKELLSEAKIFIDDTSFTNPQEIISKCRRLKRRNGGKLDFVMVDYIQLMNTEKAKKDGRQQEVTEISRFMKILAKELDVPVLALSQMSRKVEEGGTMRRPKLSDLRESGAIEQDADAVIFIHRPDLDKSLTQKQMEEKKIKQNVAEILIEKNRSGRQGMFKLYFKGECTKFLNYNEDSDTVVDPDAKENVPAPRVNLEGYEDLPAQDSGEPKRVLEGFKDNAPFDPDGAPDNDYAPEDYAEEPVYDDEYYEEDGEVSSNNIDDEVFDA